MARSLTVGWQGPGVATGTGDERSVRGSCLTELAGAALAGRADWLIIESRTGRDVEDQQALIPVLHGTDVKYKHLRPAADSGLWVADAVASGFGKGDPWRTRLAPMVTTELCVNIA